MKKKKEEKHKRQEKKKKCDVCLCRVFNSPYGTGKKEGESMKNASGAFKALTKEDTLWWNLFRHSQKNRFQSWRVLFVFYSSSSDFNNTEGRSRSSFANSSINGCSATSFFGRLGH